jgi:hypothetical protein
LKSHKPQLHPLPKDTGDLFEGLDGGVGGAGYT